MSMINIHDPESSALKDDDGIAKRKKSEGLFKKTLQFAVRLMLVATFLDDSLRISTNFSAHANQIAEQRLGVLPADLAGLVAKAVLQLGLLAQLLGSLGILANLYPHATIKALMGWTVLQPVLYAQYSNAVLVAGSITLEGGLLLLLLLASEEHGACARTKRVAARLMVPAVSVSYAWPFLVSALTLDETNDLNEYFWLLSVFVANSAAFLFLAICAALVALDIKTRHAAFVLAIFNLGCVFYQHAFFGCVWNRDDGGWMYSNIGISMDGFDLDDLFMFDDLHRYYFFLGLSSSGALLLLAQFNSGEKPVPTTEMCKTTTTSNGLEHD